MTMHQSLTTPPDFIIIGAQKSGTSSLHQILARHPDVFIPEREIFFFDVDDREQHPDFIVRRGVAHDFDADFPRYARWYASFFQDAAAGQRLGEDSTSYLASTVAPERIARLCPNVKLIALLRDPVARAYSHYWHDLARGRHTQTFERALVETPAMLISRGCYLEQLQRYRALFEEDRLLVLIFEEFREDPRRHSQQVCEFLGLPPLADEAFTLTRFNAARVPRHPELRRWVNRAFPALMRKTYRGPVPSTPGPLPDGWRERLARHPLGRQLQALTETSRAKRRYPPMPESARRRLGNIYRERNAGLGELLGRDDLGQLWPHMA